jgi:transcriptional regulator with XRE-family HTH domain
VEQARWDLLTERRKAVGLSQGELAGLLGVERSTVLRWEAGRTAPQPWVRPALADALQIGVASVSRSSEEQREPTDLTLAVIGTPTDDSLDGTHAQVREHCRLLAASDEP